jgi:hypothetical protein
MPSAAVAAAFEARLATWPRIADCPFVDTNTVSPVPRPPFVEIHYPFALEDKMAIGEVYQETGGARFVVTVPMFDASGKDQMLGWIDELRDLFRAAAFGGVRTVAVSPVVLDDRNRDDNRFRLPFVVTYRFVFTR